MSKGFVAVLTCMVLGSVTLAAFRGVLHDDFIGFDDGIYVTQNPHVVNGFSWDNVRWALQAGYAGNWHPLTWLSLMLDAQLFGHGPSGFHLTNLLLHIANTVLLFFVLKQMTGAQWQSASVAALFALHPLHVESVAWVAERKDVLSTFFFLLTLWAYAAYTKTLQPRRPCFVAERASLSPQTQSASVAGSLSPDLNALFYYVLAIILFALGLMSKPMLVTTPFVLLLLDYWPLRRLSFSLRQPSAASFSRLVLEKIPFLCLAIVASLLTFAAQNKGHAIPIGLPFSARLANAIESYWKYLSLTIWPKGLAVFYPHPYIRYPLSTQWPTWLICVAAFGLAALSVAVLFGRSRRPWLRAGWFWFLGTLVPVIGLVQVGDQAMADRYTYIPLIGIFICVAWGATELLASHHFGRVVLAGSVIIAIGSCAVLTHRQVKYWRNTQTLFEHALAVTKDNAPAQYQLGSVSEQQGDLDAAMSHYRASLEADPSYIFAREASADISKRRGKLDEARKQYETVLRIAPWWVIPHNRLAACLWVLGRREEARQEYVEAVRLGPDSAEAHFNLGLTLYKLGQPEDGVAQFTEAVRLKPADITAQMTLAEVLLEMGKFAEAESRLAAVIRLSPANTEAHINLGGVFLCQHRQNEALQEFLEAARLSPGNPVAHFDIATVLFSQGRSSEAASQFAEAVRLKPDYRKAHAGLEQCLTALSHGHNFDGRPPTTNAYNNGTNLSGN